MAAHRTEVKFKTHRFRVTDVISSANEQSDQPFGGDCALWFIEQLPLHGIQTRKEPCQEDWGWVVFASLGSARFWIGVSPTFDEDESDPPEWVAHLHHSDFRILQRFTKAGRRALVNVSEAIESVLLSTSEVYEIRWN